MELARVGQYGGGDDLQAMLAAEGFLSRRRSMTEAHSHRVDNFAALIANVMSGEEDPFLLKEAFTPRHDYAMTEICRKYPGVIQLSETMSVSDFPAYLTVDVLDRVLWGMWSIEQVPNRVLVKMETLRDFRTVKRFELDGGITPFEKQGSPAAPPPQRALTPVAPITYAPDLYQGYMSINWRALVNDELGIFNDNLLRLSSSWNLTIWKAITSLIVDASGPNASLYNSTFKNILTIANGASADHPVLDFQGLADARTVLGRMLSPDGQPIAFPGKLYLWHGPDLTNTANALLSALRADISVGGGTTNSDGFPSQRLSVGPAYITGGITDVEDKYIPIVCTSGTYAKTSWGLTYDPSVQPRPSSIMGMLRGFETPQLFQKAPNTMTAGGGLAPQFGDFYTMDMNYKAVAVFGTAHGDGRSTVASFGQA